MENNKNKTENKEFTQAEVPAEPHKIVQHLKTDLNRDVRDLYKEIIPLGLSEFFKKYNIDPFTYNFKISVNNLADGQEKVNSH